MFVRPERREAVPAAVRTYVASQTARFGERLAVPAGTGDRTVSPLDTLRAMVPDEKIIAVVK